MKRHYPADADRMVWIFTVSLIAFALLLLSLAGAIPSMPPALVAVFGALALVVALILGLGWLARPQRYEVRDDSLAIRRSRPFASITIPKSEIKEMKHLVLDDVTPLWPSLCWTFGYSGRFRSRDIGDVTILGTNPTHAVLIVYGDCRLILTPSNPKRFVHDISGKK